MGSLADSTAHNVRVQQERSADAAEYEVGADASTTDRTAAPEVLVVPVLTTGHKAHGVFYRQRRHGYLRFPQSLQMRPPGPP